MMALQAGKLCSPCVTVSQPVYDVPTENSAHSGCQYFLLKDTVVDDWRLKQKKKKRKRKTKKKINGQDVPRFSGGFISSVERPPLDVESLYATDEGSSLRAKRLDHFQVFFVLFFFFLFFVSVFSHLPLCRHVHRRLVRVKLGQEHSAPIQSPSLAAAFTEARFRLAFSSNLAKPNWPACKNG